MIRFGVIAILILNSVVCSAQAASGNPSETAQSRLVALIDRVRNNAIQRVEIFQMPPRMLTRTRVTPEMLERSFHYKLIIQDIRGGAYAPGLTAALASTSAAPGSDMGDLRWGIAFFDLGGQRIESLYFDGSGGRGAVGSLPVAFTGSLPKWLDENFGKAFK